MSKPVRVLVVDDSALMRKLIPQILQQDPSIEVVGTAMDGAFALRKIEELKPQVVTLDLEMPGVPGLEVLKSIRRLRGVQVIIVSSYTTEGATFTLKALALGAFDFVAKPSDVSSRMPEIARELIGKIRAAASSKGVPALPPSRKKVEKAPLDQVEAPTSVVCIGISTGGPNLLEYVLSRLPGDFPGTIVVVQHMPEGFTEMFARRLDECCSIQVKEARSGDLLLAGRALICPGNRHIRVKRLPLGDVAVLSDEPLVNGHRPSVDVLFRSLAQDFGFRGTAVLMTGMGEDGCAGMGLVKDAGGLTIAQSEESCVVYGMPKAAIEKGFATRVLSVEQMVHTLQAQCGRQKRPEQQKGAAAGSDSGTVPK
jgi:two-component system chemotaxis response regulator CheB